MQEISLSMTDAEAREAARQALDLALVEPEVESDSKVTRLDEPGHEYVAVQAWIYLPVGRPMLTAAERAHERMLESARRLTAGHEGGAG